MVDRDQVRAAVRFINSRNGLRGLDLASEIGAYVLAEFYRGDFGLFSSRSRSKPTRLRAVLASSELAYQPSTIHSFVRIHHQLGELPEEVARRLSLSHHRALLPLPAGALKRKLARTAADESWTRERLEREVRRHLSPKRVGRKPIDAVTRLGRGVERQALRLTAEARGVGERPVAHRDALRRAVVSLQAALREVQTALSRVEQPGARAVPRSSK